MNSLSSRSKMGLPFESTLAWIQYTYYRCFEVNDRNIAEKLVVCTKRSQVDAKKYILPINKQHAPFFATRHP